MLKIRLGRIGKTKRPHFRVVVAEHTKSAKGPYIEALGFWDPIKRNLKINPELLKKWEGRGVWASDRVSRLFKSHKIAYRFVAIHERPARGPKEQKERVVTEGLKTEEPTKAVEKPQPEAESTEPTEPSESLQEQPTQKATPAVEGEEKNQNKSS